MANCRPKLFSEALYWKLHHCNTTQRRPPWSTWTDRSPILITACKASPPRWSASISRWNKLPSTRCGWVRLRAKGKDLVATAKVKGSLCQLIIKVDSAATPQDQRQTKTRTRRYYVALLNLKIHNSRGQRRKIMLKIGWYSIILAIGPAIETSKSRCVMKSISPFKNVSMIRQAWRNWRSQKCQKASTCWRTNNTPYDCYRATILQFGCTLATSTRTASSTLKKSCTKSSNET